MKVYVGQTRSRKLIAELGEYGWGEMTVRKEIPPARLPWAFDNGVFRDWKAEKPFDTKAYLKAIADLRRYKDCGYTPDFIVVPDIVGGGMASLGYSLAWRGAVVGIAPIYLVVQDGMTVDALRERLVLADFDGIFVGGTLAWKLRTSFDWVTFAHSCGKPCHIGRVGTKERVRWARRIGADSIDSCLPLWSRDNLERFKSGLDGELPPRLFTTTEEYR